MPTLIYCTYLTVYTGNTLPPFYIGSTSIDNINKGYRGSVASKNYKSIWKQELYDHPDLFKTIILTRHETREDALIREQSFHFALNVKISSLHINSAIAVTNNYDFNKGEFHHNYGRKSSRETSAKLSRLVSGKNNPFYNKHHTEESKKLIGSYHIGPKSKEQIALQQQTSLTRRGTHFKLISPDGEEITCLGINRTCKLYNLNRTSIIKLLKGTQITPHKGWMAYYL